MELDHYVDNLNRALATAAAAGGDDARQLAERLSAPLDAAVRLMLLDALSAAADEITRDLAPGSVELRLRAGAPTFVVSLPPIDDAANDPPAQRGGVSPPPAPPDDDDGATARIHLRLPEHLKAAAEEAASRERRSLNAWLVRTVAAALAPDDRDRPPRRGGRGGQGFTGWVS